MLPSAAGIKRLDVYQWKVEAVNAGYWQNMGLSLIDNIDPDEEGFAWLDPASSCELTSPSESSIGLCQSP